MSVHSQLPAPYADVASEAKALADSISATAAEAAESHVLVPEIRDALAESGLARVMVPGRYGGRFESPDSLAATVAREQLSAESAHLDSLFAMQGIGSFALAKGGAEGLREEWLPRVAAVEAIAALALTEPDAGSDLKALTTSVIQDGSEVVVNGRKSFITNAGAADFYCVLGREGEGFSLVLVPADAVGVSVEAPTELIAPHVIGDIIFDEVRVPSGNRLGEPGKGFALVLATLATFRVSVAGSAIGVASAALREALRHTSERELFGTPLDRLGGVPEKLARSWTEIEVVRTFVYRAAADARDDPLANLHLSSMAKVAATEAAFAITDRCLQMTGRFGLVSGSKIERLFRDARPMRIYEGSSEVILDSLAKQLRRSGMPG